MKNASSVDTIVLNTGGDSWLNGGNLMVGTTQNIANTDANDTGASAAFFGMSASHTGTGVHISSRRASPLVLNRMAADGGIITFNKAGVTLGEIGVATNLNIGSGATRIWFKDDTKSLRPISTAIGNGSDGLISIGEASGGRFKDLYLSGGIQSAGGSTFTSVTPMSFNKAGSDTYTKTVLYDSQNDTANNVFSGLTLEMGRLTNSSSATPRTFTISDRGATNRWCFSQYGLSFNPTSGVATAAESLDDYEEGTWTPTLPNGGTMTVNRALYTKIGRQVSVQFYVNSINATNNGGQFQIGGLPFTTSSISNSYSAGSISYSGSDDLSGLGLLSVVNGTYLYFHFIDGTSGSSVNNTTFRGLLPSASVGVMIAEISYFTD